MTRSVDEPSGREEGPVTGGGRRGTPASVWAMAVATFAMGSSELSAPGLLPEVAADIDVPVSTAGLLVTAYALGVALGGPVLSWRLQHWRARRALPCVLVGYALLHLVAAAGLDFWAVVVPRGVGAAADGAFVGTAAVVASSLAGPGRRSRAIAVMFCGLPLAGVVGVPALTWIAQSLSWRWSFCLVAIVTLGAAGLLRRALAPHVQIRPMRAEPRGRGPWSTLVAALVTSALGWGSTFALYTYVAVYLVDVAGFAQASVPALLLVFGIASVAGGLAGGWADDRWPRRAAPVLLATLGLVLVTFWFLGDLRPGVVVALLLWGAGALAVVPVAQSVVVRVAGGDDALLSSLNVSAFNAGIALASVAGGLLVASDHLGSTPLLAGGGTLLAAGRSVLALRRRRGAA